MTRRLYDEEQDEAFKHHYRQDLANWIQSQTWDDFFTVTYKRSIRDRYRSIERAKAVLQSATWVSRAFYAAEKGNLTPNACHIHGLVTYHDDCFSKSEHRFAAWSNLYHSCGRSRIEPVITKAAVAEYCSKYVLKDANFEWDFAGCGYHGY